MSRMEERERYRFDPDPAAEAEYDRQLQERIDKVARDLESGQKRLGKATIPEALVARMQAVYPADDSFIAAESKLIDEIKELEGNASPTVLGRMNVGPLLGGEPILIPVTLCCHSCKGFYSAIIVSYSGGGNYVSKQNGLCDKCEKRLKSERLATLETERDRLKEVKADKENVRGRIRKLISRVEGRISPEEKRRLQEAV